MTDPLTSYEFFRGCDTSMPLTVAELRDFLDYAAEKGLDVDNTKIYLSGGDDFYNGFVPRWGISLINDTVMNGEVAPLYLDICNGK